MKKIAPLTIIASTLLLLVAPLMLVGCPPHDDLRPRAPTGTR